MKKLVTITVGVCLSIGTLGISLEAKADGEQAKRVLATHKEEKVKARKKVQAFSALKKIEQELIHSLKESHDVTIEQNSFEEVINKRKDRVFILQQLQQLATNYNQFMPLKIKGASPREIDDLKSNKDNRVADFWQEEDSFEYRIKFYGLLENPNKDTYDPPSEGLAFLSENFVHCKNEYSTLVTHEYGHFIEDLIQNNKDEIKNQIQKRVHCLLREATNPLIQRLSLTEYLLAFEPSKYGKKDAGEFFAEAFVLQHFGTDIPKYWPLIQAMREFLAAKGYPVNTTEYLEKLQLPTLPEITTTPVATTSDDEDDDFFTTGSLPSWAKK